MDTRVKFVRQLICGTVMAGLIASMSIAVSAQRGQRRTQPTPTTPEAGQTYSRADAELIGKRLYKAIFGREADASGLSVVTADIQNGALKSTVNALIGSAEFQNGPATKAPAVLLEQFYRGMLDRLPDTAGVQAYLPPMQRREYATVITDLTNSTEFRNLLVAPPAQTPAPKAATVNRLDAALECQGKVVDAVRREADGHIFLTFDRMPDVSADGKTVSGAAMDRTFDRKDRDMTYRCANGNATFAYGDRRPAVAPDARIKYPSVAVQNCENAVRSGSRFDAASLSASDTSAEYVLGVVGNTIKQCTMDRQRVVSVK